MNSVTENPILRSSVDVRKIVSTASTVIHTYDEEEASQQGKEDEQDEHSESERSTNADDHDKNAAENPSEYEFSSDDSSDDDTSDEEDEEGEELQENKDLQYRHTTQNRSTSHQAPSMGGPQTIGTASLATVVYGRSIAQFPNHKGGPNSEVGSNPSEIEENHQTTTTSSVLAIKKNMKKKRKMMKKKQKKAISNKPPTPKWVKLWNSFYYRPIFVFFRAFIIAWIYVFMPCDNYWIYYLVKNQYWCFFSLTSYIELFSALLPDIPASVYIACYVIGFMINPTTRVLEYYYGMEAYHILDTVTVLIPLLLVIFLFTVDTLRYPYTKRQLRLRAKLERQNSLTLPSGEPLRLEDSIDYGAGPGGLYRSMFYAIGLSRNSSRGPPEDEEEDDGGMVRAGLPVPMLSPSMMAMSFSFASSLVVDPTNPQQQTPDVELINQGEQRIPQISVDHFYEERTQAAALNQAHKKVVSSSQPTVFRTANNNIKLVDPRLRAVCDGIIGVLDFIFIPKYFWFLPRFWNHRYWLRHSKLHPLLNRRWLILRTSIFITVYLTDYLFLIYFTEYFRVHADSNRKRVGLFLIYISVNTIYRTLVKTLGMILDKYKGRTVSMFFLGEVMGLYFYYCFYRVLFESIRSIPEFAAFQFMHLGSEWVLYVLRCTKWYYDKSEDWVLKYSPNWLLNKSRMSHKHWQQFIALDFGIRCAVFITTGYGILIMLITIQYVPWVGSVSGLLENNESFAYTASFIVAAVVLEFVNAWIMNRFFFHKQGLDVQSEVRHCFSLPHFALLSLLIACNLLTNPIFAFITVDYQKK